jgi:N6-adenosine-specific RNA methylase IME4
VRQIIETQEPETLITPRSMHSRKPLEARSRLVELYGDVPRIELFARNSGDGFEAWGDQAPVEVEL